MEKEKFKVLLFLKKSVKDKSGKTPIMGRITIGSAKYGNSVAQFSCKLSCDEKLWNARESRLNGKSKIAVEVNAKLDTIIASINEAHSTLQKRNKPYNASDIKNLFQGSVVAQTTLLKAFDNIVDDFKARVGIDRSRLTLYKYASCRRCIADFIKRKYKSKDILLSQLNEQFIREFQELNSTCKCN
ncbi:MAG: Arm DNA-binding domain-containing protein [Rikenellaceae bacterium]